MEPNDLTSGECLRILLEEQVRNLRTSAQEIDSVCRAGAQAMQPAHWSGLARMAHDDLADRLLASLTAAHTAVTHAADQSARAVGTLAGRVG